MVVVFDVFFEFVDKFCVLFEFVLSGKFVVFIIACEELLELS